MQAWRGCGAVASGVDALHREAALLELGGLIFHQRDQRADHQRRAAARDAGQLVAERFARAGGHDQQHVLALDHGAADRFLVGAESGEAEGAVEQLVERCSRYRRRGCSRCRRFELRQAVIAAPASRAQAWPAPTLPHHLARTYSSMPLHETAPAAPSPRWMRCRYASHWPVIAGLLTSGCTTSISRMPLSVASRLLPLRTMYSRFSSTSIMAARVAGRAEAVLLHGVREFFFVERLAGGLHRGEQRGFGEALGRARLLLSDFDVHHVLRLALRESGRQRLASLRPRLRAFFARRDVEHLPADLLHGGARGVIAVDDRRRCAMAVITVVTDQMWSSCQALSRRRQIRS